MTDKLKDIKPGDRVRVTAEGTFEFPDSDGAARIRFDGSSFDHLFFSRTSAQPSFTIEKLSTPPVVGDRVTIGDGSVVWKLVAIEGDFGILWNDLKSNSQYLQDLCVYREPSQ